VSSQPDIANPGGIGSLDGLPVSRYCPREQEAFMSTRRKPKVRYAVVGLGHIAQAAVLPGFENARENSELVAFVSDDPVKHHRLGRRYQVVSTHTYKEYNALLRSGAIDAVYIALPNNMHRDFTVRAARAGVHVLCEKPLSITESDCEAMIEECARHQVKLMTAYRLHFEKANLDAIEIVQSGRLGEPRLFSSVFGYQVKKGNIRTQRKMGGGANYDIGIYCINAARYLFRAEPVEVMGYTLRTDARFREVDAITSATMIFPNHRVAQYTCSFDSADVATYSVIGTKGKLRLDMAYEYAADISMEVSVGEKKQHRTYPKRDQFGAELVYFSDCVLNDRKPEPSGEEGLADVRIIRAIYESARRGQPVRLKQQKRRSRPSLQQEISRPPVEEPQLVNSEPPSE
jgi:predicted dehydrogenase